jgi:hypothetical protein
MTRTADIAKLESDLERFIVMRSKAQALGIGFQVTQAEALIASVERELAALRAVDAATTTANRALLDRCR